MVLEGTIYDESRSGGDINDLSDACDGDEDCVQSLVRNGALLGNKLPANASQNVVNNLNRQHFQSAQNAVPLKQRIKASYGVRAPSSSLSQARNNYTIRMEDPSNLLMQKKMYQMSNLNNSLYVDRRLRELREQEEKKEKEEKEKKEKEEKEKKEKEEKEKKEKEEKEKKEKENVRKLVKKEMKRSASRKKRSKSRGKKKTGGRKRSKSRGKKHSK
jgi:outer membrane biosynthesis protein TonB